MKGNLFVISSFILISQISLVHLEKQPIYFPENEHETAQALSSKANFQLPATAASLQKAVNRFSWNIFQNLKLPDDYQNVVLSPVIIQLMLSILKRAAADETKAQLQNIVGRVDTQDLLQAINSSGRSNALLEVATGIFVEPNTVLNQTFVKESNRLKVDVIPVQFRDQVATRALINRWASHATHGLIPKLLSDSYEIQGLKLALTSAIYFHSAWKYRFNNSEPQVFHTENRIKNKVNFMELKQDLIYDSFSIDGQVKATVVEIPYENDLYSMVILLPNEEYALDAAIRNMRWNHMTQIWTILSNVTPRHVHLKMPKFDVTSSFSVVNALLKMGLVDPFTLNSKLPYITADEELKVSDIFQQAVMKVDENGTTAAAATGILVIPLSAGPLEQKTIVVDRPFVSIIFNKHTGIPFFISKVYRP